MLLGRSDRAKELEILVLRHELSTLRRQAGRPRFETHDRVLLAAFSRILAIGSRRVEYFAITTKPDTAWMLRQARNLLMELDNRDQQVRFLIHDRDAKFPRAFDALLFAHVLRVYVGHYNRQRPHRALHLSAPDAKIRPPIATTSTPHANQVNRSDLLGGLIHEYELAAA